MARKGSKRLQDPFFLAGGVEEEGASPSGTVDLSPQGTRGQGLIQEKIDPGCGVFKVLTADSLFLPEEGPQKRGVEVLQAENLPSLQGEGVVENRRLPEGAKLSGEKVELPLFDCL